MLYVPYFVLQNVKSVCLCDVLIYFVLLKHKNNFLCVFSSKIEREREKAKKKTKGSDI
jgi:hypothetical protein